MVTIDYDKLNTKQKQTYDFLVKVAKQPIDENLEIALGLVGKPKPRIRKEAHEDKEAIAREAEAVLLHLRRVDTLMQKECLECHRTFATNYHYAGRCSDDCIKASLRALEIEWNPEKTPQERWNGPGVNGEIPAIITPETLGFLKNWARTILSWDDPEPVVHTTPLPFAPRPRIEMPKGRMVLKSLEKVYNVENGEVENFERIDFEAEQREEEALREEAQMSGDVYGGTDLSNIDWDSL